MQIGQKAITSNSSKKFLARD